MRSMVEHFHPQVVIECWDGLRTSSKDASDCASVCDTRTRTRTSTLSFAGCRLQHARISAGSDNAFFFCIFLGSRGKLFKNPRADGCGGERSCLYILAEGSLGFVLYRRLRFLRAAVETKPNGN